MENQDLADQNLGQDGADFPLLHSQVMTDKLTWAECVTWDQVNLGAVHATPPALDDFVICPSSQTSLGGHHPSSCSRGHLVRGTTTPLCGGHHFRTEDAPCSQAVSTLPDFAQPTIQHKAEVAPIFLAYKRVSSEGAKISLMCVASAVVQAFKDNTAIDAIQPMRNGWLIYIHTMADRSHLVSTGITLAGQYVPL